MNILKNKNFWKVIIIILVIIASTILYFLPKVIDYKYPYSYENLENKKMNIESLNNSLRSNEGMIQSLIDNLSSEENRAEVVKEEADEIRESINYSDFELHMPSILIALEQTAYKNSVDLTIHYNSIVSSSPEMMDSMEDMEDMDDEYADEDSEEDTNENITVTETDNESEEDEQEFSMDDIDNLSVQIEGVNVTTIPIGIKGSYYNVRNYIKYLDEIGMIEPSSVTLSSAGKELTGTVLLNVFHGEVD